VFSYQIVGSMSLGLYLPPSGLYQAQLVKSVDKKIIFDYYLIGVPGNNWTVWGSWKSWNLLVKCFLQ